jgi:hypothetical protein
MRQVMFHGETTADTLDDREPRLALVAGAGMGKSEELRQIGRRSHRPALFQPLTAFHLDQVGADPAVTFVRCMNTARGIVSADRPLVPRATADLLADGSYVFLLDALDEVAPERRPQIIHLLNEVSRSRIPRKRLLLRAGSYPLAGTPSLPGSMGISSCQWVPVKGKSVLAAMATVACPVLPSRKRWSPGPVPMQRNEKFPSGSRVLCQRVPVKGGLVLGARWTEKSDVWPSRKRGPGASPRHSKIKMSLACS